MKLCAEREGEDLGREKNPWEGAREDDAVEKNGEKDRHEEQEGGVVYKRDNLRIRPEHDAVII